MKNELTRNIAAAKSRFEEECAALRPQLYRFCSRMTGSPCDGEDVLQETLAHAFYRLPELQEAAALKPWLFRIAHRKCIDSLRAQKRFDELDEGAQASTEERMDDELDKKRRAARALSSIVTELPPKERACVLLKDVVDCSLDEIAVVTGSNVGAVKIALHRGRAKLEESGGRPPRRKPMDASERAIVERYLDAFNRRDWNAVRAMLSDEAHLEVVERAQGPIRDTGYFTNHEALKQAWRVDLAWVDGVEEVVHFREDHGGAWRPHSIVRLFLKDGKIAAIRDFLHIDHMLDGHDVTI